MACYCNHPVLSPPPPPLVTVDVLGAPPPLLLSEDVHADDKSLYKVVHSPAHSPENRPGPGERARGRAREREKHQLHRPPFCLASLSNLL